MIVLPFLTGGSALVAAVLLRRLWLATLPRSVCPECGEPTASLTHPLSSRTDRWIRRRWCADCGWTGWGRNGPVLWPKDGPIAHDSGFRWGEERLQPDFGFRWAAAPAAPGPRVAPTPRDAHPSGFRWAGTLPETLTAAADADHPSGFRFRPADEEEADTAGGDHPSGFRWGAAPVRSSADFRWKS